ncbi:hypothetical protein [Pedobacter gandavensis]|uniref:hypothetical protein n=1 Tax=Pedobacter gandavensis TaxID=2679963 RepID=UPI002931F29A|nr:hypothetical protein [Pedobacter gandavensis]
MLLKAKEEVIMQLGRITKIALATALEWKVKGKIHAVEGRMKPDKQAVIWIKNRAIVKQS